MSIKCKIYNGKLYCYDKEKKSVKVFLEQNFSIEECPITVLQSFLADNFDAEIIFNDPQDTNA